MKADFLKVSVAALSFFCVAAASTPAMAEDASPYGDLSATLTMQSDYRFRGISQNNREATPEMSVDWGGPEGFYFGTFLAKTDWGGNNPSYENDWYLGKTTDLMGTTLDTGVIYYGYPDATSAETSSFMEVLVSLSHSYDKLTLTGTGGYSPEWSLKGGTGWYAAAGAELAINDWLSMSANFGNQWVKAAPDDYAHWDIGLTASWRAFSLDVRYLDTNISKADCSGFWMATKNACKAGVSVSLSYNIANVL